MITELEFVLSMIIVFSAGVIVGQYLRIKIYFEKPKKE